MLYETFTSRQIHPCLPQGTDGTRLVSYARERDGLLADDGARWAVLILPGGRYQRIAPAESEPVALAFAAAGIQAFVLHYSVLPQIWPQQFLEAAAAIAFIRNHAEKYGVRPDRVAVCGFSAGGHLAGCLANQWKHPMLKARLGLTKAQVRPDAAILCYPVVGSRPELIKDGCLSALAGGGEIPPELQLDSGVCRDNPPAFLWSTLADESVPVEHTMAYARALREQGVPFELHLFADGPHAMGLASRESARDEEHYNAHAAVWHPLCVNWLKGR